MSAPDLHALLAEAGLGDKVARIDDRLARLQWGSAFVVVGISGSAIVAIAPLFRSVPTERTDAFYRRILELNAHMGGIASFAIQPDGWVVLHAGRALKGLDGAELMTLVAAVGRFADQYDDQLIREFYAAQLEATNQAMVDEVLMYVTSEPASDAFAAAADGAPAADGVPAASDAPGASDAPAESAAPAGSPLPTDV